MNKTILIIILLLFSLHVFSQSLVWQGKPHTREQAQQIDTRIDNMGYWMEKAKQGIIPYNAEVKCKPAIYKGSEINTKSVLTEDSPDIPVSQIEQSEVSVFIDPNDNTYLMNSNNSGGSSDFFGSNFFFSNDEGQTFGGQVEGAGGENLGDPAAVISLDGRFYVGFIHSNNSQGVSYSTDAGTTWTSVQAGGVVSEGMLDKNHLWIDNSPTSDYEGNVYNVWTDLTSPSLSPNYSNIEFVRTTDGGETWSTPLNISANVEAGSHNQGVNVQTGPNGEVYTIWVIYDSWPADETAIGFNKSYDGGVTFEGESRILSNIKGIRQSITSKNMRVASFPSMSVDMQTGTIYIVWTNIGEPGINTGTNRSIYLIKSEDEGETWSDAIRVNQGAFEDGKEAYMPWMTCDPETGVLSVIYYDDRNVSSTEVEAWVSNSHDAGETWDAFRVSDVAFTPEPMAGMAYFYMGDYLGIAAKGGMVYPAWCDNRTGEVLTYVSPYITNNRARPENLELTLTQETGVTNLTWEYDEAKTFEHFIVYRDDIEIGTTVDLFYIDNLPDYGDYTYAVTAMHDDGESYERVVTTTWGLVIIEVNPSFLTETLEIDQSSVQQLTITNNGQLDLTYNLTSQITSKYGGKAYCSASGANSDYISGVVMGDINNTGTGQSYYADYTAMSTNVTAGDTYPITITIGDVYANDDIGIWIDWNLDENFDDAGENVICEYNVGDAGTYNYEITIPEDANAGATRMRIRTKYSGDDCGSPCGTTYHGEVEDYTLIVSNWIELNASSGTVTMGNTDVIDITFLSQGLTVGTYNATISITSNDPETPSINVPVTLNVEGDVDFAVSPVAVPQNICSGANSHLYSNAIGGSNSFTYSWTSNPAGFTSSEENPMVNPTETTTYSVAVNDGNSTLTNDIVVIVMDEIDQSSIPTGPSSVGNDNNNSFYYTSAENATYYQWQMTPVEAGFISGSGATGIVNWNNDFIGTAYISAKGLNECGEGEFSEELEVEIIDGVYDNIKTNNKINWNLYPNPTKGKFILDLNSELQDKINIEIYDITGKVIYSDLNISVWAYNSRLIDLTNSPAGIYIIHVSGKDINETKQIIIE